MPEITLAKIKSAHQAMKEFIHLTPVHHSAALGNMVDIELYVKCENFQKTGSFKARGALHKFQQMHPDAKARGVVSVSAGNHAQGMAWAAAKEGIKCTIVMPDFVSKSKLEATRGYGATVILMDSVGTAFAKSLEIAEEEGSAFIHPFDDADIITGHGTVGLEILEQLPDVEAVVVGIGGGALASGIAIAIKDQKPDVKIYGVEPEGANATQQSIKAGKVVTLDNLDTIADGLAPPMAGVLNLAILSEYLEEIVTVSDKDIGKAMEYLISRTKLLAEPSGAASTAAILSNKISFPKGAKVVTVLSGGNVDLDQLKELIS